MARVRRTNRRRRWMRRAEAATHQWRIIRDWIAVFFEDQFEVAPESFVTRLRPR